jgi:hypothetical protein
MCLLHADVIGRGRWCKVRIPAAEVKGCRF